MEFDLVSVQPCLSDFKVVRTVGNRTIQSYVQAKGDAKLRGSRNKLTKVSAARQGRYFFDTRDRHGFFYFTFDFAGDPPKRVIYFFPEKVVPDHFYTTMTRYVDFSIEAFRPYRIELDGRMQWIEKMQEIIEKNPEPRKDRSYIPPRPVPDPQDGADDEREVGDDEASEEGDFADPEQNRRRTAGNSARKRAAAVELEKHSASKKKQKVERKKKLGKKPTKKLEDKKHSRMLYKEVMSNGHRRFFYSVMTQCAERGRGLIVEFARNGSPGDFGFCRYRWTQAERNAFFNYSHVPAAAHDLPSTMPIVAIFYYCRHRESWFAGPKIAPRHYERLNLSGANSLIFWDISGPDVVSGSQGSVNGRPLLAIVPSEDVQPTSAQKSHIESSIREPLADWEKICPSVSSMLSTGRFVGEYCLPRTPMDAGCDWSAVWTLLDKLSSAFSQVEHPRTVLRDSSMYRQPLQAVNQRLAEYWDAHKRNNKESRETGDEDTTEDSDDREA